MRIEDTDIARSTEESTRSILEGLEWLGFSHDEEIVFQSDNADKHRATALKLLEEGKAYRDFTPKENPNDRDIKAEIVERARANQGEKNMRDNEYRDLPKEESDRRAENGEPFAIRLKVAETEKLRLKTRFTVCRNAITTRSKTSFCCVLTVIRFIIWRSSATTSKWKSPT